jgi:hypothetical protein
MSKPTDGKPRCGGCGKTHLECHPVKLIALADGANICGECVDLAAEIVHEDVPGGTVRVAPKDLEDLRRQARESGYAAFWLDMVRDAMQRADAKLKAMETDRMAQATRDFACWYLNEYGEVADHSDEGVQLQFNVWCAALGLRGSAGTRGVAVHRQHVPGAKDADEGKAQP